MTTSVDRDELLARLDEQETFMREVFDGALKRFAIWRAALLQAPHPDPEQDRERRRLVLQAVQHFAPGWRDGLQG